MKFGGVIRLLDRNPNELTDSKLRTMEAYSVTQAVAWVLGHLDDAFHTHTLELLPLEKYGDEVLLAGQMRSGGYVDTWGERLQSKTRGPLRPVAPADSGS